MICRRVPEDEQRGPVFVDSNSYRFGAVTRKSMLGPPRAHIGPPILCYGFLNTFFCFPRRSIVKSPT